MPQQFWFTLESFEIDNTRSPHNDTDFVSCTLAVGQSPPQTKTKAMGDLNNGTFPVGLSFGPVNVDSNEAAIFNYLIVNKGHGSPDAIQESLVKVGSLLAQKGASAAAEAIASGADILVGASIGSAVLPIIGTALGVAAAWIVDQLSGLLWPNCDGPVAAEQVAMTGDELAANTADGQAYRRTTFHPGVDSANGCGSNSRYKVTWEITVGPPTRAKVDGNVLEFQPLDENLAFVLGTDGKLWREHGPFGIVPPPRELIDGNVQAFQAIHANLVFTLGSDGKLWRDYAPFGPVPPPRVQVDGNVQSFQVLPVFEIIGEEIVFVLGTDGKLWRARGPFGQVPPNRDQVDANVAAFQALDANTVFVLGTDSKLWRAHGPFGQVPPSRDQVDANVAAFQALDINTVFVLGTDGNLWRAQVTGAVPPPRTQVDGNVRAFEAYDSNNAFVLGMDRVLWRVQVTGAVPPPRVQVDTGVAAFRLLDLTKIFVLTIDRNLWRESEPFQ